MTSLGRAMRRRVRARQGVAGRGWRGVATDGVAGRAPARRGPAGMEWPSPARSAWAETGAAGQARLRTAPIARSPSHGRARRGMAGLAWMATAHHSVARHVQALALQARHGPERADRCSVFRTGSVRQTQARRGNAALIRPRHGEAWSGRQGVEVLGVAWPCEASPVEAGHGRHGALWLRAGPMQAGLGRHGFGRLGLATHGIARQARPG